MGKAKSVRWSEVDHSASLVGHDQMCVACGQPARVQFSLRLELDGAGERDICKGWSCARHQVETQEALVDWAVRKGIARRQ